jgi:hypothetical protein
MQDLYPSENGGGPEALDRLHAALRADAGADGFYERIDPQHSAQFTDGADTLLVVFEQTTALLRSGRRMLPLARGVQNRTDCAQLTLVADRPTWFRSERVFAFFDGLIDDGFFDGFERVVFYGAGAQGYAAAAFSVCAPGAEVLLLQPQATLTPLLAGWDRRFAGTRRVDFSHRYGFAPAMMETAGRGLVLYDPGVAEDAMHASLFHQPRTDLVRVRHLGPEVEARLDAMGLLAPLLDLAVSGQATVQAVAALLRKRRTHSTHQNRVLSILERGSHPWRTAVAARHILALTGQERFDVAMETARAKLLAEGRDLPPRRATPPRPGRSAAAVALALGAALSRGDSTVAGDSPGVAETVAAEAATGAEAAVAASDVTAPEPAEAAPAPEPVAPATIVSGPPVQGLWTPAPEEPRLAAAEAPAPWLPETAQTAETAPVAPPEDAATPPDAGAGEAPAPDSFPSAETPVALADGLVEAEDPAITAEETPDPGILLSSPVAEPEPETLGPVGAAQPVAEAVADPVTEDASQALPEPESETPPVTEPPLAQGMEAETPPVPETVPAPSALSPTGAVQADGRPWSDPTPEPTPEPDADTTAALAPDAGTVPAPKTEPAPADLSPAGDAPADAPEIGVQPPAPTEDSPWSDPGATTATQPGPETPPPPADPWAAGPPPADMTPSDIPAPTPPADGGWTDPATDTAPQPGPDDTVSHAPDADPSPIPGTDPAPADPWSPDPSPVTIPPADIPAPVEDGAWSEPAPDDAPRPAAQPPVRATAPSGPKQTPIERLRALRAPPKPGKRKK